MSIEFSTAEELRDAINNGEEDIFIINRQLAKRINTIRKIKKMGPVALGAAIGAIPVIVFTGPAGFMIGFWSGSASGVFAIAGLIVAIGDRKSNRLTSRHYCPPRMPSSSGQTKYKHTTK